MSSAADVVGVFSNLATGVANHFAISAKGRRLENVNDSARLAAIASSDMAATRAVEGSRRTMRRRHLRDRHRDRVQQAVFIVECQLRGLRCEIASIREQENCTATWDRRTLISLRHTSLQQDSGAQGVTSHRGRAPGSVSAESQDLASAFSSQQEKFLLGFLEAAMTLVAEGISERLVRMQAIVDTLTAKSDEQSMLLQSLASPSPTYAGHHADRTFLDGGNPVISGEWEAMQFDSHGPCSSLNPDASEFVPAIPQEVCASNAMDWLMCEGASRIQIKRYVFVRRPPYVEKDADRSQALFDDQDGISSFEQLLRDASIVISQADLYGGGTSAVVTFIKDSAQHELRIDVNDKPRLLKLLRMYNVKVRSHFNLTRS